MKTETAFLKRLVVGVCTASLIGSSLVGCLTVPTMPDMSQAIGSVSSTFSGAFGNSLTGSLSGQQLVNAQRAQSIMGQASNGTYKIGYSTDEYQQRLNRFHETRDAMSRSGGRYSESQFMAFSGALTDLLNYVDAIETLKENPQVSTRTQAPYASSYTIAPGAKATFSMQGMCLDRSVPAPSRNEPLQLVPIKQVWPEPLNGVYQNLIANYEPQEKRRAARGNRHGIDPSVVNIQTAIWALQKFKDGDYTGQAIRELSTEQQALLLNAGFNPATMATKGASLSGMGTMALGAAKNMATEMASVRLNTALGDANRSSNGMLGQALDALPVSPVEIMNNPAVLQNPDLLMGAMTGWLDNHEDRPASTFAGAETGMTLLADGVAARSHTTNTLRADVEIVNASSRPFVFSPREYALNARSSTQPVGPSEWRNTRTDRGVELVTSPMDNTLRDALEADLRLLAMEQSLDAFTRADGAALQHIARTFSSRGVQRLVGALPVVGNVIALGKIMTGKNLDGSDMDPWDYAAEAVALVPVAGNIAKLLGPTAVDMTRELMRRFPDRRYIEGAFDIAGSRAVEEYPAWMERRNEQIARQAVAGLPNTSASARAAGIRI